MLETNFPQSELEACDGLGMDGGLGVPISKSI